MENANYRGYNSPFAQRLRQLIEENGIKHSKLADENVLNVSRQSISQYCDGTSLPPIDKIVILAKYFNVSTDYLLGLTNIKTTNTDLKAMCEYTGLCEKSIKFLKRFSSSSNTDLLSVINFLLSDANYFFYLLDMYAHSFVELEEVCIKEQTENPNLDMNFLFEYIPFPFTDIEYREITTDNSNLEDDEEYSLEDDEEWNNVDLDKICEKRDDVYLSRNNINLFVNQMIDKLNEKIKKDMQHCERSGGNGKHQKN